MTVIFNHNLFLVFINGLNEKVEFQELKPQIINEERMLAFLVLLRRSRLPLQTWVQSNYVS
jgi:hypothetical protein